MEQNMIIIGQQKGHKNEEQILSSSAENLSSIVVDTDPMTNNRMYNIEIGRLKNKQGYATPNDSIDSPPSMYDAKFLNMPSYRNSSKTKVLQQSKLSLNNPLVNEVDSNL